MTALWIAVGFLFAWQAWSEINDRWFSRRLRELEQRASDDGKDIASLAKSVQRLEHPTRDIVATYTEKKPLTAKKPRRRTPPRR